MKTQDLIVVGGIALLTYHLLKNKSVDISPADPVADPGPGPIEVIPIPSGGNVITNTGSTGGTKIIINRIPLAFPKSI